MHDTNEPCVHTDCALLKKLRALHTEIYSNCRSRDDVRHAKTLSCAIHRVGALYQALAYVERTAERWPELPVANLMKPSVAEGGIRAALALARATQPDTAEAA